jgi:hypothetical protein
MSADEVTLVPLGRGGPRVLTFAQVWNTDTVAATLTVYIRNQRTDKARIFYQRTLQPGQAFVFRSRFTLSPLQILTAKLDVAPTTNQPDWLSNWEGG